LHRIFGVDLTEVPGFNVTTGLTLFTEVGPDLSPFRCAPALASWLGLCPGNKVSGGKILDAKTRRVQSRAAEAFRMAACSLHSSQSCLGSFHRRPRTKLGAPKAITAAAHKLARIFFHLATTKQPYDASVFAQQEAAHRNPREQRLKVQARECGYQLTPIAIAE
jgi:transposase